MSGADTAVWTAIATGTGCGLVIVDSAGLVEYLSPQLAEVSGVDADQAVGKSWLDLVPAAEVISTDDDDSGAGLIDTAPVLSKVSFYPVDEIDDPGRKIGVLRLVPQVVDSGDGFPFALETAAGIPSRRALFEQIQSQLACQDRYKTPFSLIFIRIKNYSTFIEALGTENWENTNRAVFDQLNVITRMADSVGLYDEATFWMILINSAPEGTKITAEKIKLLAGAMKIDALDLFLSVAVAGVMARPGENSEALIQRGLVKLHKAIDATSGMVVEE